MTELSTTADLNDYSSRVNITGVTIASIPIDIVAQTIGNITIDIAAASMGPIAISINVVDVVGNIPIDIVAQTIGNISIDIAAASMGSIAVSINVVDVVGNIPIDIVAQTIGNISIDIAAQTVGNIGIDIAANSFGTLPIDIVAQTIGNIGISINANTAGNITVDIAAQTMVGNLSIDIAANSFGNLPIDIVAQTIGNIGINLAANTLGNLTIDIAAQTLGNIAIDVAAQTVDLNIKTSGGVNIIIDKLTQGAYTERQSTLSNEGVFTDYLTRVSDQRGGKFFPRGARGFFNTIDVYCRDAGAAGGTITVYLAPNIGMGPITSKNITVPAGGAAAWRSATFNIMWNYDSIFIWVVASSLDMKIGYTLGGNIDSYQSLDAGATWTYWDLRVWIRAVLTGETVGDIPVSGTLNTIEIPKSVTIIEEEDVDIGANATVTLTPIDGAGMLRQVVLMITAGAGSDHVWLRVYADGVLAARCQPDDLNAWGYTPETPCYQKLAYAEDGVCAVQISIPIEFRRQLYFTVQDTSGNAQNIALRATYALIH